MKNTNPAVDFYFENAKTFSKEMMVMRKIVLGCGLSEALKWGVPCYTLPTEKSESANIVLIHVFKEYCAYLFFKGALMDNSHGLLIQQTENVQAARQIRFTNASQVKQQEAAIKAAIFEAIDIEKAGLKVELKKTKDFDMPEELTAKFKQDPKLKSAFTALTPGRLRAYIFHFSDAKQTGTRSARIEKSVKAIMAGKGLLDK
ncbi:MAG: hypothetical protein JWQ27_340 [Ferruginibacter sp.]|nr:hypothetical protein [Ferruginibacter sp.]